MTDNNTQAVAESPRMGITQMGVDWIVDQFQKKEKAGLRLPANYSVRNAAQSAYLMLQEAETKDGQPLLTACTQQSIAQALMQMMTQGLNPVKKQCYFVAYGNKCKLVPSYFGTLAVLNRVKNLKRQPVANVVHQGDVFEYGYDLDTMELKIRKHETKLENLDAPIIAAYAVITTDRETVTEIMSRRQIENAWGQGQSWQAAKKRGYESKTHVNFAEEMAKKTVLNRAAKKLINATDDSSLMADEAVQAFNETGDNDTLNVVEEQVSAEIAQNANTVPFTPVAINAAESKTVDMSTSAQAARKEAEPSKIMPEPTSGTEDVSSYEPDFMSA